MKIQNLTFSQFEREQRAVFEQGVADQALAQRLWRAAHTPVATRPMMKGTAPVVSLTDQYRALKKTDCLKAGKFWAVNKVGIWKEADAARRQ